MDSNKTPINQRDTLPVGYDLHWYKLLEVIGRGGYGITYLALDKNLDRKVAIKEYLPMDFAHREANDTVHPMTDGHKDLFNWGLKRFLVEARTLAKFNHPSIIKVLSVFEHNKTAYMVMDYEEGDDLAAVYKHRKPFSEQELLNIFVPVIEGLADVHETGFIHRDVKPSNIYIRTDGSSVLLDFGSARQTLGTRTRALTSLVTAGYAPFEQYNESEEEQGPWTDIYGLGATLYYCITGKKPIDALERGSRLLKSQKDIYEPLNPSQYPGYSAVFLHAIDQALMFQPEDRPQNALNWVEMLTGKIQLAPVSRPPVEYKTSDNTANDERTVIRPTPPPKPAAKSSNTKVNKTVNKKANKTKTAKSTAIAPEIVAHVEKHNVNAPEVNPNQQQTDVTTLETGISARKTKAPDAVILKTPEKQKHDKNIKLPVNKLVTNAITLLLTKIQEHKPASSIAAALLVTVISIIAFTGSDDKNPKLAEPETKVAKIERTPAQQVEVARQQLVTGLLSQAKLDIADGRFFEPPENNAVFRYKKIMAIKKDHPAATGGLKEIADHFIEKIEAHVAANNWKQAKLDFNTVSALPIQIAELDNIKIKLSQYDKQQKLIHSLLASADKELKRNRLTKPRNRNALHYFEKVIEQDPSNQQALEGLSKIVAILSDVLNRQIASNRINSAEKTFELIESIDSDAPVLAAAESKFGKIYKNRKQIRALLATAENNFINGQVITPKGNNALANYRKVLNLSPKNKKALNGLDTIFNYYLSSFTQFINEEKFDKASDIAKTLKRAGYSRKRIVELNNTIEKEKLAIKNEPETVRQILEQLEAGINKRDLKIISKMSIFKSKQHKYVDSIFKKFSNISADVRQQSHDKRKHQAYALIKLKGKTEDDIEYDTESKLDINILVRKEKDKQWKVIW